jgi:ribonuclease HI
MKNIYITTNNENFAILFSKEMVKEYKKFYPTSTFSTETNLHIAFDKAKPPNYNSTKIYAVKTGFVKGMFFSNDEFLKFTSGFKEPKAKKCKDISEAYKYIFGTDIPKNFNNGKSMKTKPAKIVNGKVYTDGSYLSSNNLMGVGYEIYSDDKVFSHSSFIKVEKQGSSTTAELISAMMAVERAIDEGLKSLTIVHDNAQIEAFASNCNTKKSFNKKYYNYIKERRKIIDIKFEKVKAHSGDQNNDKVDRMIRHKKIDKFIDMI